MTRVLIALGGNAMTSADGQARQEDQLGAVDRAVERIADVAAGGAQVLLTHGNGPQVGNLLVKNELAAHVVPPVSLDWCGAQTQGTIGFILVNALERAMAARGLTVPVAAVVTRTLVDAADPGFVEPTKPVGRFLPADEAKVMIEHGQRWRDLGRRGWRRVVASPEPLDVLDAPAVLTLLAAGYAVVAAGGGGIPVVREADGSLHGVEAVIDKDLAAAVLARVAGVQRLVIATDVDAAWLDWGTDHARPVGAVSVAQLRRLAAQGHFGSGSMGPKVEAACRFVEGGGELAAIAALDRIADAAQGRAGTVVTPD
ncbi:MAG TPA: carbamate kinase [Micromonosporaceae bacterium]|nr:carbamate kinase [Micromonosporaceae bacterium]